MVNKYETLDIKQMADFLKCRKRAQIPTILFLGSRCSSLLRSNFLYETLNPFQTGGLNQTSSLQRFAACFHTLKTLSQRERDEIINTVSRRANVKDADTYIAQLAKHGFFNMLVTTDIATTLESAFVRAGMQKKRDFDVLTDRSDATKSLADRKPLLTLVNYFDLGDLTSEDSTIKNRTRPLEPAGSLNQVMDNMRDGNILIAGLDPLWDQHIIPKLFPRNGNVWYINEEPPPENAFLADELLKCKAQCIFGTKGRHERFFRDLSNLIGAAEPYPPTSKSGPLAAVEDAKQTAHLQRSLKERAEEVRRKASFPPMSLTVTAHRLYSYVPSGVFAYYDLQTMPLIKYAIKNEGAKTVTVVLAAEIQGFSHPHIDTVDVPPRSLRFFHYQLPRLDEAKVSTLTETAPTSIHIRISYLEDGVELLYNEQDFEVHLTARNVIRWVVPDIDKEGTYRPLFNHIAAWVTPRADAVRIMFRNAIDYHPQKALMGYPRKPNADVPRSQVKAIFQALKRVGKIAHVNSPFVVSPGSNERLQTIHLPDESLRMQRANSIDGAVLYASLIESASLQPVIVIQARHAFVGWKTGEDATPYEFLDTTMTLSHSFEEARAKGMDSYRYLQESGCFDREPFDPRGFARLLDIKELRDLGIFPM